MVFLLFFGAADVHLSLETQSLLVRTLQMIKWGIHFDIWYSQEKLKDFIALLQLENTRDVFKLKFIKDQNRRAFGYYLIQKCIQNLSGHYIKQWNSIKGKPVYDGLSFNVSHDGEYVVIVGEYGDYTLGVDVCFINMEIEIQEFKEYITEKELNWINSLKLSKIGFYVIWALKEATTKGIGDGMAFGFKRLEFVISHSTSLESLDAWDSVDIMGYIDEKKIDWDFSLQFLDNHHVVAVASNNKLPESKFEIRNVSVIGL